MDRLASMQAFAKVVDEGGFAAAARALDVSASAVTRLVADLERHLGARLIQRSTRRVALTSTGQGYLERVRRILGAVQEAEAVVSSMVREPEGRVRVALPGAWAARVVARPLHRLREKHPRVMVELAVSDTASALDDGFDVALVLAGLELPDSNAVARRLARCETILCASPDYLALRGAPQAPSDLRDHECLFDRRLSLGLASPGKGAQAVVTVEGNAMLDARQPDTVYAAATAGLGIVALPQLVVSEALAQGRLVRVLPQWQAAASALYAVVGQRRYLPASSRAVLDHLVSAFEPEAPATSAGGPRTARLEARPGALSQA